MYCRTCGNKINANAEMCVKCGCKPLIGKFFCQECGAKTTAQQTACTKCGVSLKSVMTMEQKKKTIEKKGVKILGTLILAFGIICFAVLAINMALKAMDRYYTFYLEDIIQLVILGAPCVIVGNIIRKKVK